MDFSIETSELQKAVKLLRVSARPNSDDVSGRATIKASEDNKVLFFATNTYTSIEVECPADVKTPGEAVIPYGKIISFVTSYHPWDEDYGVKEFRFKTTSTGVLVSVDNIFENGKVSKGKLKLGVYKGYGSTSPSPFKETDFILNSNIFKQAVSKVIYAIDASHAQTGSLQGMYMEFGSDHIYFTGMNGAILSEFRVDNISDLKEHDLCLRNDFVMGLKHALSDETQIFWDISSDKRQIKVKFDNVRFFGRKIIGSNYPKYRTVLDNFKNTITVEKRLLLNAIDPFMGVLDDTDHHRLTLDIKENKLSFYCDAASVDCDSDVSFDNAFTMDINGKYLKETVEAIQDDILFIKFSEKLKPLIFDSGNFENQKALIVPLGGR